MEAPQSRRGRLVAGLRRHPVLAAGTLVAAGILGVQLVILITRNVQQYQQYNLGLDYAIFHQAWYQIAHGHLSPSLTDNPSATASPYWRSHFELIMWPLALLYWVAPNDGLTLLVIQDLAIVGAAATALWWVVRLGRARQVPDWLVAVVLLAVAVLSIADRWEYATALEDFHFEAVGACLALLVAYQLWAGHTRRCLAFVVLTLLCGDVPSTLVFAVGVAFACTTPRVRRLALLVGALGLGWLLLAAALGANQGSLMGAYAYLAGTRHLRPGVGGFSDIATGILTHPSRAYDQLGAQWPQTWQILRPTGVIGVVSPWTWAPTLLDLTENQLNGQPIFHAANFQSSPVYLLGTAGTGLVLVLVAGRRAWRAVACVALVLAAVVPSLVYDVGSAHYDSFTSNAEAGAQLQQIRDRTPADAEVVVSFGVMGRFAGRASVHTFTGAGTLVPIDQPDVVFVFAPRVGNPVTPQGVYDATRAHLLQLGATVVFDGSQAQALEWHPGPTVQIFRMG
jgi:hypothetical protein